MIAHRKWMCTLHFMFHVLTFIFIKLVDILEAIATMLIIIIIMLFNGTFVVECCSIMRVQFLPYADERSLRSALFSLYIFFEITRQEIEMKTLRRCEKLGAIALVNLMCKFITFTITSQVSTTANNFAESLLCMRFCAWEILVWQ